MRDYQAEIAARAAQRAAEAGFTIPEGWQVSDLGACRSCGERIAWCITPAGKRAPVDPDGTSHFATCPQADRWRRKRGG